MNISVLNLVAKLTHLEKEFAETYGSFSLFALMLREEFSDRWDLIISATWLEQINSPSFAANFAKLKNTAKRARVMRPNHDAFMQALQKALTSDQLVMLSRVVSLAPESDFVRTMNELYHLEHGKSEVTSLEVDGTEYKRGYVITSQYTPVTSYKHTQTVS